MTKKNLRMTLLATALVAALGLSGCGGAKAPAEAPQSTEASAGNVVNVGIIQFAEHGSLDNCRTGFVAGLAKGGYIEGENLRITYNNAQADTGIANQIANQYASQKVDMICAIATPAAQAAYNAGQGANIPVVFTAVSDPIGADLAKADGSVVAGVTGTSDALPLEAQVKMIRSLMPEAKTIGILYSTSEVNSASQIQLLEEIVPQYGFTLVTVGVNTIADVPMAVDNILTKVDCLNNLTDNTVVSALDIVLDKANAKGIPVFGSEIEQVIKGCAASESLDYIALGEQTGLMAARVLDGEDITTLPFETIKESKMVYNQAAFSHLGLSLPADLAAENVAP